MEVKDAIKNVIVSHELADRKNVFIRKTMSNVFPIETPMDKIIEWYLETDGCGDLKILIPR